MANDRSLRWPCWGGFMGGLAPDKLCPWPVATWWTYTPLRDVVKPRQTPRPSVSWMPTLENLYPRTTVFGEVPTTGIDDGKIPARPVRY